MKTTLLAVVAPLLFTGCATQAILPEVLPFASPVQAGARAPKTHHHTTLTGYVHRNPVAPDPWVPEEAPAPAPTAPAGGAGQ